MKKVFLGKFGLGKSALGLLTVGAALFLWTAGCESDAHRNAECEKADIRGVIDKESWGEEDYRLLYRQTGLAAPALDALASQGRREELFLLQEEYFKEVRISCRPNTILSREEYLVDEDGNPAKGMSIPCVEDGDILITFCSHAFGWRNGHAAIVVDGENRLVLEAQVLGSPSVIVSLDRWERYPSFLVLRLKDADQEERARIAAYAKERLTGIPYHLTAGMGERLLGAGIRACAAGEQAPAGTQCAHLVWYAYAHFGYDLDSNGGLVVTPANIAQSDQLIIVQSYGR